MTYIFLAQLLVPVTLVIWFWRAAPRSRLGWTLQLTGSLALLTASMQTAMWLFPPWWTPLAGAGLLVAVALRHWRRVPALPGLPTRAQDWIVLLLFAMLACGSGFISLRALTGSRLPAAEAVSLKWPLAGARFLVVNGGNDVLVNAHMESFLSDDPRFIPWRGNRWAIDIVAIDVVGMRAHGVLPVDPARYRIFGMPVLAPCSGSVLVAVDGLPDMPVPAYDRSNPAGNHVLLSCNDSVVVLAHLQRGSVRVRSADAVLVGQQLGAVGNSGGSNEPHLHIHAQRPGPPDMPMGGDPLPMVFSGRFLVRGDRIEPTRGWP